jgi:hypothetical protein
MIVLFGAEFTQQWAARRGVEIEPKQGAVRVIEREEHVRPGQHRGPTREGMRPAAHERAPTPAQTRGGIVDYLVGLPVLYLLFRRSRR